MLAAATLLALPLAAQSAPKNPAGKHAKTAARYECPICHHQVNAAKAKSLHYTCPVDKGKLAPIKHK